MNVYGKAESPQKRAMKQRNTSIMGIIMVAVASMKNSVSSCAALEIATTTLIMKQQDSNIK